VKSIEVNRGLVNAISTIVDYKENPVMHDGGYVLLKFNLGNNDI
jgi:hypothetical protein